MSPDPERLALWWGPGILLLLVFGYGALRLAHYSIEKLAEFKRQQMDSIFGMARQYIEQFLRTQGSQADALSRLATTVEQRESVESFEHQEILIALKALHREVAPLARKLAEPAGACQPPASLPAAAAGSREGGNGNPP